MRNLDYIFTVSSQAMASAATDILANLENILDQRSSEMWSYRRLPTPTATFPAIVYSEEDDSENEVQRTRDNHTKFSTSKNELDQRLDSFLQPTDDPNQGISRQVRALRKKLQQIDMLEVKQSKGHLLDDQQIAKLQTRSALESSLAELGAPVETPHVKASSSVWSDAKGNKKAEQSRKQKRNSRHRAAQMGLESGICGNELQTDSVKEFLDTEISQDSTNKDSSDMIGKTSTNHDLKESGFYVKQESVNSPKNKSSLPAASKKKNKKGGLSMFLSGALDDAPKVIAPPPPPPTPKSEGPAWGGLKISKGSASLREIQDEQSKIKVIQPSRSRDQVENALDGRNEGKIPLCSFLTSKPIPMVSPRTPQASDGDKCTPPWTASGTPPLSRPSLRDIQKQQKGKHQQNLSQSPKTKVAGFSITTGQGSPSDSTGMNRWFKPEADAPSSIRSIQLEEKAMKDLKRYYSSVKIVRNQS